VAVHENVAARLPPRPRNESCEGAGTQLCDHQQRSGARDDPGEGVVSKLGDCLFWETDLHRPPPVKLARENHGTWCATPGGVLLSAAGWVAVGASRSAPRVVAGERETQGKSIASANSLHRSHPGGAVAGIAETPARLPHKPPLGTYRRFRNEDHCRGEF